MQQQLWEPTRGTRKKRINKKKLRTGQGEAVDTGVFNDKWYCLEQMKLLQRDFVEHLDQRYRDAEDFIFRDEAFELMCACLGISSLKAKRLWLEQRAKWLEGEL